MRIDGWNKIEIIVHGPDGWSTSVMKALRSALVISLLANVILAWLLWTRHRLEPRVSVPSQNISKLDGERHPMPALPAQSRSNPSDDPSLRKNPFGPRPSPGQNRTDRSFSSVPESVLKRFEDTRNRNLRPNGGEPSRSALPPLDSDLLRPAHLMAPYPSHREDQTGRGLYYVPSSPRRLP